LLYLPELGDDLGPRLLRRGGYHDVLHDADLHSKLEAFRFGVSADHGLELFSGSEPDLDIDFGFVPRQLLAVPTPVTKSTSRCSARRSIISR